MKGKLLVEEFDIIDSVFDAVEDKIYKKYAALFKSLPEGSFTIEWSLEHFVAQAETVTNIGARITKTLATGGFILRTRKPPEETDDCQKTLMVMFPSAIMVRNEVDDDIDRVRCALNHDFYHEFIHYVEESLSEIWVETAAYVLSMEECICLDCKYCYGGTLNCDLPFTYVGEIEDIELIPVVWDAGWERYYAKIRKLLAKQTAEMSGGVESHE